MKEATIFYTHYDQNSASICMFRESIGDQTFKSYPLKIEEQFFPMVYLPYRTEQNKGKPLIRPVGK